MVLKVTTDPSGVNVVIVFYFPHGDQNWPEKWHTLSSPPADRGSWRVPGVCGVRPAARRGEWNIFIIAVVCGEVRCNRYGYCIFRPEHCRALAWASISIKVWPREVASWPTDPSEWWWPVSATFHIAQSRDRTGQALSLTCQQIDSSQICLY